LNFDTHAFKLSRVSWTQSHHSVLTWISSSAKV
jgi:hypothetical protein